MHAPLHSLYTRSLITLALTTLLAGCSATTEEPNAGSNNSNVECVTNDDCPGPDRCILSVCSSACITNDDCGDGKVCRDDGSCATVYANASQCPSEAPRYEPITKTCYATCPEGLSPVDDPVRGAECLAQCCPPGEDSCGETVDCTSDINLPCALINGSFYCQACLDTQVLASVNGGTARCYDLCDDTTPCTNGTVCQVRGPVELCLPEEG